MVNRAFSFSMDDKDESVYCAVKLGFIFSATQLSRYVGFTSGQHTTTVNPPSGLLKIEWGDGSVSSDVVPSSTCMHTFETSPSAETRYSVNMYGNITGITGSNHSVGQQSPWIYGSTKNLYCKYSYVELGKMITSIGPYAFYNCAFDGADSRIYLRGDVTSIGAYAFYGCTGLEMFVGQGTSRVETIGNFAFTGATGMYDFPFSGVTSIGENAFKSTSVRTISLGSVSVGYGAFYGCTALTSVSIRGGSNSTRGSVAFAYCAALESYTDLRTSESTVRSYGDSYLSMCPNLTTVHVQGVSGFGQYAFTGDTRLQTLTNDYSGATSFGNKALYLCTNLRDVYVTGTTISGIRNQTGYPFGLTAGCGCVFHCSDGDLTV